jgi:hypothetical protein
MTRFTCELNGLLEFATKAFSLQRLYGAISFCESSSHHFFDGNYYGYCWRVEQP